MSSTYQQLHASLARIREEFAKYTFLHPIVVRHDRGRCHAILVMDHSRLFRRDQAGPRQLLQRNGWMCDTSTFQRFGIDTRKDGPTFSDWEWDRLYRLMIPTCYAPASDEEQHAIMTFLQEAYEAEGIPTILYKWTSAWANWTQV